MKNITKSRVVGHGVTGGRAAAAPGIPLTPRDILGGGLRRRARRREILAAQSTWDSEGGATGESEWASNGVECRPPRGLGG
jgi:hypothetical protein